MPEPKKNILSGLYKNKPRPKNPKEGDTYVDRSVKDLKIEYVYKNGTWEREWAYVL